jgi:hypothetical protein
MLSLNDRIVHCEDHRFSDNEANVSYANHLFTRLSAKEKTFTKVDFRYCTFDRCYLRSCKFLNCDFTGCRFVSSNLHGSSFRDCRFDYASFERTQIAPDILETQAPFLENLKEKFARSLRVNYSQLGDSESVNKAIKIELAATQTHLYNAWHSEADYYRKTKYPGMWMRFTKFLEWLRFRVLLRALRMGGTIAQVGVLTGPAAPEPLPVPAILHKQARLRGIYVGSRRDFMEMNRAIALTQLRPVGEDFPWTHAREVLGRLEESTHFGKLVMTIG